MEVRALTDLRTNPNNPRGEVVVDGSLRELAESIAAQGVLQPILITPDGMIVAGHRRFAACGLAGVSEIPVVVREMDEALQIQIMLVENLQREDLNPVQVGVAALQLRQRGISVTTIAKAIGIGEGRLKTYLALAQFPKEVQQFYIDGELKLITISAMAELTPKEMIYWANRGVNSKMTGNLLCSAIRKRHERGQPRELLSQEELRQEALSNMADKLTALAERIDNYPDLRPIARKVNDAAHELLSRMMGKSKAA
jgi:ParB family transcriptional regulator, chromosome partitioning protein